MARWSDKLSKVDKADVTINDTRFIYDFRGESFATLNGITQETTSGAHKRNNRLTIGYRYPQLRPGTNKIKSNVRLGFERKDRWL